MVLIQKHDMLNYIQALIPHVMSNHNDIEYQSIRSNLEKHISAPEVYEPIILTTVLRQLQNSIIGRINLLEKFLMHVINEISRRKQELLVFVKEQENKCHEQLLEIENIRKKWQNQVRSMKTQPDAVKDIWQDLIREYNNKNNHKFICIQQNPLKIEIHRFLCMPSYTISRSSSKKKSDRLLDINRQLSTLIDLFNKKKDTLGVIDKTISDEIRALLSTRAIEARRSKLFVSSHVVANTSSRPYKELASLLLSKLPEETNEQVALWKCHNIIDSECQTGVEEIHINQKHCMIDFKRDFVEQANTIISESKAEYIATDNELRKIAEYHRSLITNDMLPQLQSLCNKFQSLLTASTNKVILEILRNF